MHDMAVSPFLSCLWQQQTFWHNMAVFCCPCKFSSVIQLLLRGMFTNTKMESVINAPQQLPYKGASLESEGSFQSPPSSWGLEGACWAPQPRGEGLKLGWQIHTDCPPWGQKTVPLHIFFFFFCDRPRRARQGWVRCRAVALGVRRRGMWLKEVWRR